MSLNTDIIQTISSAIDLAGNILTDLGFRVFEVYICQEQYETTTDEFLPKLTPTHESEWIVKRLLPNPQIVEESHQIQRGLSTTHTIKDVPKQFLAVNGVDVIGNTTDDIYLTAPKRASYLLVWDIVANIVVGLYTYEAIHDLEFPWSFDLVGKRVNIIPSKKLLDAIAEVRGT
jgi:hypothetical protein